MPGPKTSTRLFVRQSYQKQLSPGQRNTSKQLNRPLASRSRLKSARGWRGKRIATATAAPGSAPRCSDGARILRSLCPDVYSGTAGVGLFLAALWQAVRIEEVRLAAVGAIRQALAGLQGLRETNLPGLYTGALGVCWAAVRAAISLEKSGLVDEATIELQLSGYQRAKTEDEWDLLAGHAGAIVGLLWLRQHLGDDSLMEWATQLGQALIAAGARDRTWSQLGGVVDTARAP